MKELAKSFQPSLPHSLQEIMLSSYFCMKSRRIHGAAFSGQIDALTKSELLGPGEMQDLHAKLLKPILEAAAHTRFYRELFRRIGIQPARLRTPDDLKALPLLEKDAVRRDPESFIDERRDPQSLRVAYTSGTTGTPLRIYLSPDYEAREEAFIMRQWRWAGLERKNRRIRLRGDLILPAGKSSSRPWLRNFADHELRMSSYHLDASSVRAYISRINAFHPRGMIAYPSSASLLAVLAQEHHLECRLPLVFTSSETLFASQRESIKSGLGARVFDHYGSTEAVIAIQECEAGSLHVIPEYGVVEFIPLEIRGMEGVYEMVGTGLVNHAMPLLRYRTGDYARLRENAKCSCGRSFPVVEEVLGRDDDFVLTASGALAGRLDHVFKGLSDILRSQIIQEEDRSIRVLVVPGENFSKYIRQALIENIQTRLGGLPVSIEEVSTIPAGVNGKFRAVVSRGARKGVL